VTIAQESGGLPDQPWAGLPSEVADTLRPGIPALSLEIIDAIGEEVPAYARPLEGSFGAGVRIGVEQALTEFVDLIEDPGRDRSQGREVYVRMGRGEARAGRTMEALLAAYRIGARIAWRRVAEAARAAELGEQVLARLAESIFAYIDELSGASAEGHAQEQAAAAGELQRRRRRLVLLLVQSPHADERAVEDAAADAGWELPRSLAVLVWRQSDRRIAHRLPPDAIAASIDELACALVPDPDAPGRHREIQAALGEHPAVIGPTLAWQRTALSYQRAAAAHRLIGDVVSPNGLIAADDHLATLMLHSDRALLDDLARQRLTPLGSETASSRERLCETLLAWLDRQGSVREVAEVLHVHPQTVRYRLGRLRERFGAELDDPQARFELGLVLRARAAGKGT
jgi:PucR C-terminal helix-turn-helix domain